MVFATKKDAITPSDGILETVQKALMIKMKPNLFRDSNILHWKTTPSPHSHRLNRPDLFTIFFGFFDVDAVRMIKQFPRFQFLI